MTDRLRQIIDREQAILSRLLEIADTLIGTPEPDPQTLDPAIKERQNLLEEFAGLEKEALELRGSTDTPAGLADRVSELKALAAKVEKAEAAASAHLDKVLGTLKEEPQKLAHGKNALQGYSGAASHLSRFTDRKG